MTGDVKIAFYVRNAFQVRHLRPLWRAFPHAVWVVKGRKHAKAMGIAQDKVIAKRLFLRSALDRFDVVVSHAGPPGGRKLSHAQWCMVQYGYAKEPYNFGSWRKQAQAIMAYGHYAAEKFAQHAPVYTIGNPRWDDWAENDFAERARRILPAIDPNRSVALYAPTWGDLSSLPDWGDVVRQLGDQYTVLVKAHHNAVRDGVLNPICDHPHIHDVSHVDLMSCLAVADVMVSDYSGAIFDAIMCNLPVVLLDLPDIKARFGDKLDASSLEIAQRDVLGHRVTAAADLPSSISAAIERGPYVSPDFRDRLFFQPPSVSDAFRAAVTQIVATKH